MVSPFSRAKDTSLSASTVPTRRRNRPPSTTKVFRRCRTSSSDMATIISILTARQTGQRGDQFPRVGFPGPKEQLAGRALLHHAAVLHDGDPLGILGDQPQ